MAYLSSLWRWPFWSLTSLVWHPFLLDFIVNDTFKAKHFLFPKNRRIEICRLNPNFIWMPKVCHYGIWYSGNKKRQNKNEIIQGQWNCIHFSSTNRGTREPDWYLGALDRVCIFLVYLDSFESGFTVFFVRSSSFLLFNAFLVHSVIITSRIL